MLRQEQLFQIRREVVVGMVKKIESTITYTIAATIPKCIEPKWSVSFSINFQSYRNPITANGKIGIDGVNYLSFINDSFKFIMKGATENGTSFKTFDRRFL